MKVMFLFFNEIHLVYKTVPNLYAREAKMIFVVLVDRLMIGVFGILKLSFH